MTIALGSNIQVTGFRDTDPATFAQVRKQVEDFVRHISTVEKNFRGLHLTLKQIHKREKSEEYELHVLVNASRIHTAELVDRNLLVGIDKVFTKVERGMSHDH